MSLERSCRRKLLLLWNSTALRKSRFPTANVVGQIFIYPSLTNRNLATTRKFCRFNKDSATALFSVTEIPASGFCLSAFVLLTGKGEPNHVLMGKLNPDADWENIGALDRSRVLVHSTGWMLPSSHLIFRESPREAANRIALEQLEMREVELRGPTVVSYVDKPRRFPEKGDHWDLEFVFNGEIPVDMVPNARAWTELKLVDLDRTSKADVARSHEDILESQGFRFGMA